MKKIALALLFILPTAGFASTDSTMTSSEFMESTNGSLFYARNDGDTLFVLTDFHSTKKEFSYMASSIYADLDTNGMIDFVYLYVRDDRQELMFDVNEE